MKVEVRVDGSVSVELSGEEQQRVLNDLLRWGLSEERAASGFWLSRRVRIERRNARNHHKKLREFALQIADAVKSKVLAHRFGTGKLDS